MKTSGYIRLLAVGSFVMAPFAAYSQDSSATQACVAAFVAQNFPGQTPIVKVERDGLLRMPLELNRWNSPLKLTAAKRESGEVLVTAVCTKRKGVVTLAADYTNPIAVVAAR